MTARNGQVALYLIAVLAAVAVLTLMNVDVFLAIRAKNHATNAGDAAAISVAGYQGELLNDLGKCNIDHLKAAVRNDWRECEEIMERQRRIAFLDPLEGIRIGSESAKRALNGCETGGGDLVEEFETSEMQEILAQHVHDVRGYYSSTPELYPPPWEGAWEEYAQRLALAAGGDVVAGPENAEFANAYAGSPLLDQDFYNAVAGEMWCWFKWNGMYLFDCDHSTMPRPVVSRENRHDNSEIYSLHVNIRSLPLELDREWTNVIMRLAECSEDDIERSVLLTNMTQKFVFYDSRWGSWIESGFSVENGFPIVGDVKPEYDVYGCAALCRVVRSGYAWTAAAKPFGTVENLDGEQDVVTCLKKLVIPAFTDVRLVPVDSVGGEDLHTADYDWMMHVQKHLPVYFSSGPVSGNGCWYCEQLCQWESPSTRSRGRNWLKFRSGECVRNKPSHCNDHGGTAHAH